MKVLWTQTAIGHLTAIHQCIARDSPPYARRMIDRITSRAAQIAASPNQGQRVSAHEHPAIRGLAEGPYHLIYRLDATGVQMLAVMHSSRETSGDFAPQHSIIQPSSNRPADGSRLPDKR